MSQFLLDKYVNKVERTEMKYDNLRHVDLLMAILNHSVSSQLTNSEAQSLKCLKVRPPTSQIPKSVKIDMS